MNSIILATIINRTAEAAEGTGGGIDPTTATVAVGVTFAFLCITWAAGTSEAVRNLFEARVARGWFR